MIHEIWENLTQGIFNYAMDSYNILGIWLYPLLFIGIIGYVYASMQSVTVGIIGILLTIGIFGATTQIFQEVPMLVQLLYIITILGLTLLLVGLFIKRSRS
jgi:hypothetical protein